MKTCSECNKEKKEVEFYRRRAAKDGRSSNCKECHNKRTKIWRDNNSEKVKKHKKEYNKEYGGNPENIRKKKIYIKEYNARPEVKKRIKEKHRNDPKYRINHNLSGGIMRSIHDKNFEHTFDILGYSCKELMDHLEKQFKNGMNWHNYGKWHIDHIKPISLFKFNSKNDPEFKECWSLDNLQPLWAEENLKKSNKYKE